LLVKTLAALLFSAALLPSVAAQPGASANPSPRPAKVEIRKENGHFRLYRDGLPYFINGAVYIGDGAGKFPLNDIASCGGNSIRMSARLDGGETLRTLEEAQRLGMTALVNLPMRMESVSNFNYSDPVAVSRQFDEMKKLVIAFKDHPAVLMWAIGNELSVDYKDRNVWNAVNDVAKMIHAVDPNHPVLTVIGDGGLNGGDIGEIQRRAPNLDLLGINYYQGIEDVAAKIRAEHWDKPYLVTEWGPSGDWQVKRTAWGASIEESSTEKAQLQIDRYRNAILADSERCLGSYVFIWHDRHERTETWYGMFLESGERTERVNAMQYLWTGQWPAKRAPVIEALTIDGKLAASSVYLKPGSSHTATLQVRARDPKGDPLVLRWEIMHEVMRAGYAGIGEKRSQPISGVIQKADERDFVFTAPKLEGAYRVFVYVLDSQGNAATANIPFFVRP
jgi:hypothetical protein